MQGSIMIYMVTPDEFNERNVYTLVGVTPLELRDQVEVAVAKRNVQLKNDGIMYKKFTYSVEAPVTFFVSAEQIILP